MLIHLTIKVIADSGYQRIQKIHTYSQYPKKRSTKKTLTKEDRKNNRTISKEKIANEHVIVVIKRFKIVRDKYRNRRKRFGLKFNLI